MSKHLTFLIALFALTSIFLNADSAVSQESLYKRLGGYDAIAAVSDDFIARLASDSHLSKFLVGLNDESKKKLRQHLVDFICNATGGPCMYLGRDMKTAHTGLKITESEWDVSTKLLQDTLDKFHVGSPERDELIGAVASLKEQIVGQ